MTPESQRFAARLSQPLLLKAVARIGPRPTLSQPRMISHAVVVFAVLMREAKGSNDPRREVKGDAMI